MSGIAFSLLYNSAAAGRERMGESRSDFRGDLSSFFALGFALGFALSFVLGFAAVSLMPP